MEMNIMNIMNIQVNTHDAYTIHIGGDLLNSKLLIDCCKPYGNRLVIITDDNVEALYSESLKHHLQSNGFSVHILSITPGEQSKTREVKQTIEDQMLALGYGRDTCMIALGGGVITDLAGFVAATYCRGIPIIYCPTTLLGMVDAGIGGKTGVNTPHGKNLIGTFAQPKAVIIDTHTLITLPEAEVLNGMVECIKHSLIASKPLFNLLLHSREGILAKEQMILKSIIADSCQIKVDIITKDEREQNGVRQLCNVGHTIGHAIENICDYQIRHGQAVAIGILVEAYMAKQMAIMTETTYREIVRLLKAYQMHLPFDLLAHCDMVKLKQALTLDKKAKNQQARYVLLAGIGDPFYTDQGYAIVVPNEIVDVALSSLFSSYQQFSPAVHPSEVKDLTHGAKKKDDILIEKMMVRDRG